MKFLRYTQVVKYGWQHSKVVSAKEDCSKSRISIFIDILRCYGKYRLWSNNYVKENFYKLSPGDREVIGERYKEQNTHMDKWYKLFYEENCFYSKYGSPSWENTLLKRKKRDKAYMERFHTGKALTVGCDVKISTQHYSFGQLSIGEGVHFSSHCDLDYTGGLFIGNGVEMSDNVRILTHGHTFIGNRFDDKILPYSNRAYATPLTIEDNVYVGAHVIIMPGVKKIGENSIISVGSVVSKPIPPNSIVAGNPAKVIFEMPEGYRTYFKYKKG